MVADQFFGGFLYLVLAFAVNSANARDECNPQREIDLGTVRPGLSPYPGPKAGKDFWAWINIGSPYQPRATWRIKKHATDSVSNRTSVFYVPYSHDGSDFKDEAACSRGIYMGQNYALYCIFEGSYVPDHIDDVHLSVNFKTPCNEVRISAKLTAWIEMGGMKLPTLVGLPERNIEFYNRRTKINVTVGLKLNASDMHIANFSEQPDVVSEKKNGRNNHPGRSFSRVFATTWKGEHLSYNRDGVRGYSGKFELTRKEGNVGLESLLARYHWTINIGAPARSSFTIETFSQFALQRTADPRPAVWIDTEERDSSLIRKLTEDEEGTLLLPLVVQKNSTYPLTFVCWGEHALGRPNITVHRKSEETGRWKKIRRDADFYNGQEYLNEHLGYSQFNYYAIDPMISIGESALYKCKAAYGGVVARKIFKVIVVERIDVTTPNQSPVALDDAAFNQDFRFTCNASEPGAKYEFYSTNYFNELVYGSSMDHDPHNEQVHASEHFTITESEGIAHLDIRAGYEPTPALHRGRSFRLVCVAKGKFTSGAAYVDFVSEIERRVGTVHRRKV
ncbi:uncharacterized protein LOC135502296 [Lineus longissimus]|uniref:uncharacterized protein LOC135502296 n=1 Tax=Lineus longissimus TaxID=88925 RepID=UPI002B4D7709